SGMLKSQGILLRVAVMLIFFFQAEDGIRDRNVTGVQTCALPISSVMNLPTRQPSLHRVKYSLRAAKCFLRRVRAGTSGLVRILRSEERRVGKEGGCRCAA